MIQSPFRVFDPYADRLRVDFLTKNDDVHSDADIARIIGQSDTVGLRQLHGDIVHVVRQPSSRLLGGDGLMTDVSGLTLTIRFADCQGLLVYAPRHGVVGLIHAGWRGIVAKVIPSFFHTLATEWGINPRDVIVGIGPSLCTKCAEFSNPEQEVPSLADFTEGKCVDLRGAADAQLSALGVVSSTIERLPDCTRCNPAMYWTYRGGHREQVGAGYVNAFAVTLH